MESIIVRPRRVTGRVDWSQLYPALKPSQGEGKIQVCLKDARTHDWELTMHIVKLVEYGPEETAILTIPNVANTFEGLEKFKSTGLTLRSSHRLKISPIRMGSYLGAPGLRDAVHFADLTYFNLTYNELGFLVTFKGIPIVGLDALGIILPFTRINPIIGGIARNSTDNSVVLPDQISEDVIPRIRENAI